MRALVQRVTEAAVSVDGHEVAAIGRGLLVLVGVTHGDDAAAAQALARKTAHLRIMREDEGVAEISAQALVISQFTLYADTRKGRRPSWSAAAPGPVAEPLVDAFAAALRDAGVEVRTGVFGADMRVQLINDGPVTILLEA